MNAYVVAGNDKMEWLPKRNRNGNVYRNFKSHFYWHEIFNSDRVSEKKGIDKVENVNKSMFVNLCSLGNEKKRKTVALLSKKAFALD